ncbi:MAG: glutamate mutase L [Anaerolineales bacterium]|nr:glutamate mutase L [Anaerolineales bacterium]
MADAAGAEAQTTHEGLPTSAAGDEGSILALGVDTNLVRACLLEPVGGVYRLAAWQQAPLDDADLAIVSAELLQRMSVRLHRVLWSERDRSPLIASDDRVRYPPLSQVAVAASPRSHVRVWLAGLAANGSLAAAQNALSACPAQIIGVTAYSANLQIGELADTLAMATPELIVLVGGFDNPDAETHQPIFELARIFGQALTRTAPAQRPAIVYAGNRWASPRVVDILQSAAGTKMEALENVLPAPDTYQSTGLIQAVNFQYWRLSRRIEGIKDLTRWVTSPAHITTLEGTFSQLIRVWMETNSLGYLHGLYAAPAWWLHIWAQRDRPELQARYIAPRTRLPDSERWPPIGLISGEWPNLALPTAPSVWWDRSGMAAFVANVGQVAPQAMLQVLRTDLFEQRTTDSAAPPAAPPR